MAEEPRYQDAESKLVDACHGLIDQGIDDLTGYELFVRVYMDRWLGDMCQVALRLAESEILADGAYSRSSLRTLARMRAGARKALRQALYVRDGRGAAMAAMYSCGVTLAAANLRAPE